MAQRIPWEGVGKDVQVALAEHRRCTGPQCGERKDLAFLSKYRDWPLCHSALHEAQVDPNVQRERDAIELQAIKA